MSSQNLESIMVDIFQLWGLQIKYKETENINKLFITSQHTHHTYAIADFTCG